jgi:hypothetical protein
MPAPSRSTSFEAAGQAHHRPQARHPHPPGARRRAHPLRLDGPPGDIVPTTPTSTRRGPTSSTAAVSPSTSPRAEGRDPGPLLPFKGNMDVEALERACESTPGRAAGDDHRHQQLRRRDSRSAWPTFAPPRDLSSPRRARSSSTPAASPRTPGSSRREPGYADKTPLEIAQRDVLAGRRLHDERQEGRHGQHRRLPGPQRRRDGQKLQEQPHPHRGLPDLRRAGRLRPRGDRRRAWRRCCTRTTCATASARWPTSPTS